MAELFIKQAKQYAEGRPSYPQNLFEFIASKTSHHELVWDVGTGSGQAAQSLARMYKNVVGTDTSPKQLEFAAKLPNVRYAHTTPVISLDELERKVASQGTVDLITIAQALHWFELESFYKHVKWVCKKPHGVIAAWCYTLPLVNDSLDSALERFYNTDAMPYWENPRKLVDDAYRTIHFPFESVDGESHTGPFEFVSEKLMGFDDFLIYLQSWSAYQTAKEKGVELLGNDVVKGFESAWSEDGNGEKVVRFPIYLRIGRVGNV